VHHDDLTVDRIAACIGIIRRRLARGLRIVASTCAIPIRRRRRASICRARLQYVHLGQPAYRRMPAALNVGENPLPIDIAFPNLAGRQLRPRVRRNDHGREVGRSGWMCGGYRVRYCRRCAGRRGGIRRRLADGDRGDRAEREHSTQHPRQQIGVFGHEPFYDALRRGTNGVRIISTEIAIAPPGRALSETQRELPGTIEPGLPEFEVRYT